MDSSNCKWEEINDERNKYGFLNPKWNKVQIDLPSDYPLGSNSEHNYCVLSERYKSFMDHILNYNVRADDIWIITYPKSGTTWTQEMVWLINNNCDIEKAKAVPLHSRAPTLRKIISTQSNIQPELFSDVFITLDTSNEFSPPFHIKNHLPAAFLPRKIWSVKPKIIYVARNPKDAAISFYHHYKTVYQYDGTKEEFFGLFLDGLVEFAPQTSHLLEFWNLRNEKNILFLTFEEMKHDLKAVISKVAQFLEKSLTTEQVDALDKFLQIDSMRNQVSLLNVRDNLSPEIMKRIYEFKKGFFRRGEAGSHTDEMPEEFVKKFDELIHRELTMKGCDLYSPK